MMARSEIKPADHAIFADTKWEPKAVYAWLDWLEPQLPFPVHRVSVGDLRANVIASKNTTGVRFAAVPWHVRNPDGTLGMGSRQCTREYKLDPLRRKMRELVGRKGHVEVCIGISTDEAHRMKPARNLWQHHTWPLIDAGMSRGDCLAWMERNGYPQPAKSSCLGCPYHSDAQWLEIKRNPEEWADVVEVDRIIRKTVRGMRGQQFMHRSCKPLEEADLNEGQRDLFGNECEGMCGV